MFKKEVPGINKIIEYGIYSILLLNIMDAISTYIGIRYFNAYEANEKVAYLFGSYGMILPMILKILLAIILCYIIKVVWDRSDFLLSNEKGYVNFAAIISNLNILFIVLFLNFVYIFILINNLSILYK